jgi:hypothetical protein
MARLNIIPLANDRDCDVSLHLVYATGGAIRYVWRTGRIETNLRCVAVLVRLRPFPGRERSL